MISPWHSIPTRAGGEDLYHFVCEIPKGTTAKMEIIKEEPHNPIMQDTKKDGSLRYYKYNPEVGSLVNYGAIPQTWEDPNVKDKHTNVGGDNYPIDALQLNDRPCQIGEVYRVRIVGAFALVDGGKTDWKILAVDADDAATDNIKDVSDVPDEKKTALVEWFKHYKTAEGKPL